MRRIAWILAVALIVAGLILWVRHDEPSGRPIRNVLLISLDTTRADHLGCYGFAGNTTPNLDGLAAEGVLFENTVAPTPLTLPSHTSMLTGTIPPYHGVHDNLFLGLRPGSNTLAGTLKSNGFTTGAIVSTVVLHRIYGLDSGFETYQDRFDDPRLAERRGDEATQRAIEWIEQQSGEPFFLFLHYYDPHFEYAPPEPFASSFPNDPYAGEIAFMDHCVGQVIDTLKAMELYDSTLIVVVGDHGEMLEEHDEYSHGYFIYQAAIRVPLILRVPGIDTPRRVPSIAGVVDVAPTICSLLGLEPPAPCHGIDLSPRLGGEPATGGDRFVYSESLTPTKYLANGLRGLVGDRWKYIRTTRPELYDLVADPQEQHNVVSSHADVADELDTRLAQRLAIGPDSAEPVAVDQATLDRLRSLGYVGGRIDDRTAVDESRADPKDLIELHSQVSTLERLASGGQLERAEAIGRSLMQRYADLAVVQYHVGVVTMRQGRLEEATGHFKRALELDSEYFLAAKDLAETTEMIGQLDEAIDAYRRAISIRPNEPRVHYNLARLLFRRGEAEPALRHLTESTRLNPEVPVVQSALASVYLELGRDDEAIAHYRRVVELAPHDPRFHDLLAWLLITRTEPSPDAVSQAVTLATRACELTQRTAGEPLDTLAAAQAAGGDYAAAIATSEQALALHRQQGKTAQIAETQRRLTLYRARQPYREADPDPS